MNLWKLDEVQNVMQACHLRSLVSVNYLCNTVVNYYKSYGVEHIVQDDEDYTSLVMVMTFAKEQALIQHFNITQRKGVMGEEPEKTMAEYIESMSELHKLYFYKAVEILFDYFNKSHSLVTRLENCVNGDSEDDPEKLFYEVKEFAEKFDDVLVQKLVDIQNKKFKPDPSKVEGYIEIVKNTIQSITDVVKNCLKDTPSLVNILEKSGVILPDKMLSASGFLERLLYCALSEGVYKKLYKRDVLHCAVIGALTDEQVTSMFKSHYCDNRKDLIKILYQVRDCFLRHFSTLESVKKGYQNILDTGDFADYSSLTKKLNDLVAPFNVEDDPFDKKWNRIQKEVRENNMSILFGDKDDNDH